MLILIAQLIIITPLSAQQTFQKTWGGIAADEFSAIHISPEGITTVCGRTESQGAGWADVVLMQTDLEGNVAWSQIYGLPNFDGGNSMAYHQNGIAVAGLTRAFGAGDADMLLLTTAPNGDFKWASSFGSAFPDEGYSVEIMADGGYTIAGYAGGEGLGGNDAYLVRTDSTGNLMWGKVYGGSDNDWCYDHIATGQNGAVMVGHTSSFGHGAEDIYIIRVDDNGEALWSVAIGGPQTDIATGIAATLDNAYVVCGYTNSFGIASMDAFLIKIDPSGNLLWSYTYGTAGIDVAWDVTTTPDSGFAMAGYTNGDGFGADDVLAIKTSKNGWMEWAQTYGATANDQGKGVGALYNNAIIVAGFTQGLDTMNNQGYLIKTDSTGASDCHQQTATFIMSDTLFTWMSITDSSMDLNHTDTATLETVTDQQPDSLHCGTCEPPVASFDFTQAGSVVHFSNHSTNANSFFWDYGNGQTSNLAQESIDFGSLESYDVCLTVTNSCGTDSICQTVSLLSYLAPKQSTTGFNLYPNPTNDWITIDLKEQPIQNIRLFDVQGRQVLQLNPIPTTRSKIDLSTVGSGIYFLEIQHINGLIKTKVIKW